MEFSLSGYRQILVLVCLAGGRARQMDRTASQTWPDNAATALRFMNPVPGTAARADSSRRAEAANTCSAGVPAVRPAHLPVGRAGSLAWPHRQTGWPEHPDPQQLPARRTGPTSPGAAGRPGGSRHNR